VSENEQLALRVATIIGKTSAAHKALMELRSRRERGERVELIRCDQVTTPSRESPAQSAAPFDG